MVKLKRLLIRKYRNVKPGTELRFDDGINVLLGRNGTGKTTLLELISIVLRGDFSTLKSREFDLEYTLGGTGAASLWTVDIMIQNAPRQMPSAELPDTQIPVWSLQARVSGPDGEAQMKSKSGEIAFLNPEHEWQTGPNPFGLFEHRVSLIIVMGLAVGRMNPKLARGVALVTRKGPIRFDEAVDYNRSLTTAKASTVQKEKTVAGVPVGIDLEVHSEFDLPPDVGVALKAAVDKQESPDTLRLHADTVPLLAKIARAARGEKIDLLIPLRRSSPQQFVIGPYTFELTKRDGTTVGHDDLSFGEKRMLAFFWYLASNPDTLIADELVNGLHHEWIETCIQEIGERQAFVTAQNPLLVDYLPDFTSAEQVANRFIQCRSELRDVDETTKAEEFVWGNMSAEDAERFFRAYEVGIQHVGEILRTEGLW